MEAFTSGGGGCEFGGGVPVASEVMRLACIRWIGVLLALLAQVSAVLTASGVVQVCTLVGSETGHAEISTRCVNRVEPRSSVPLGQSFGAGGCWHSLADAAESRGIPDRKRVEQELTGQAVPAVVRIVSLCRAVEICCAGPSTDRPCGSRTQSPTGLPRPPPGVGVS